MRFVRHLTCLTVMTATLLAPTVVSAEPEQDRVAALYAHAAANNWGPEEWHQFEVHVFLTWVESIVAPTGDLWDRVALCETGGYQGVTYDVPNWAMKGPRYSGGLGFANTTWTAYRYEWMPANAGDANRAEQILVAERVRWELKPYGSLRGKWGCAGKVGAP